MAPDLFAAIDESMRAAGIDLALVGRAWARATPLVVLVPAFGLRALPVPARVGLGLAFGACIFSALAGTATAAHLDTTAASIPLELLRGIPIALATAVPLWAATMAGGLADTLRGAQDANPFVLVEGRATPIAILFSLAAGAIFLSTGGPSCAVLALANAPPPSASAWLATATHLANGITLAVGVAAPVLAGSIVLEIGGALIARASSPAHIDALIAPVKAIALLVIVALGLDRMVVLLR